MFLLAHLCHLSPADVDALTVGDFWHLVDACDRQQKEWAKDG